MTTSCLRLVKGLKRDPCSLPPFTMNQDTVDLPQILEDKLGGAVRYACTHWTKHLRLSPISEQYADIIVVMATEMLKSAPPWIEVMSLENNLEGVIHSMHNVLAWLDEVSGPLLLTNMQKLVY